MDLGILPRISMSRYVKVSNVFKIEIDGWRGVIEKVLNESVPAKWNEYSKYFWCLLKRDIEDGSPNMRRNNLDGCIAWCVYIRSWPTLFIEATCWLGFYPWVLFDKLWNDATVIFKTRAAWMRGKIPKKRKEKWTQAAVSANAVIRPGSIHTTLGSWVSYRNKQRVVAVLDTPLALSSR